MVSKVCLESILGYPCDLIIFLLEIRSLLLILSGRSRDTKFAGLFTC